MTREQVSRLKFYRMNLGSDCDTNRKLRGGYRNDEIDKMYYNPTYGFEFMILKDGTKLYRYDGKWHNDYEQFLDSIKDIHYDEWKEYPPEVEAKCFNLICNGVATKEELLMIDNLEERLRKIGELNLKMAKFLLHASDEDFKNMFSECEGVKALIGWQ